MENKSESKLPPKGYAFLATCGLCVITMILWIIQFKFLPALLFGLLAVLSYFKATGGYLIKQK